MTFSEVTTLFREAIAKKQQDSDLKPPPKDKRRILKSQADPFEKRAKEIIANIARLKTFLLENRAEYLNIGTMTGQDQHSDVFRDKIDAGANNFIRTCNCLISRFKSDLEAVKEKDSFGKNRILHLELVTEQLDAFLKAVCEIYTEQKAVRVKKELEVQTLSRLESNIRKANNNHNDLESKGRALEERLTEEAQSDIQQSGDSDSANEETRIGQNSSANKLYPEPEAEQYPELSPEEIQLLEAENEKLFEDLINVQDDVQQIETKVVKIAELQEIFTEKVLQQKEDIDLIALNAVTSTENIKDGNEELRKAIQNQASIRVYILFFLLVMSFSLLFLDWYND